MQQIVTWARIAEDFASGVHARQCGPAHKVEDLLAALLVREARLVVAAHDAPAGPGAHAAAQVGLPARAHAAVPAEGLCPGTRKAFYDCDRPSLIATRFAPQDAAVSR